MFWDGRWIELKQEHVRSRGKATAVDGNTETMSLSCFSTDPLENTFTK